MSITIRPLPSPTPNIAEFNARLAWETEGKGLDPSTALKAYMPNSADPAGVGIFWLRRKRCGRQLVRSRLNGVIGQNGWFWWIPKRVCSVRRPRQRCIPLALPERVGPAKAAGDVTAIRLYVERENEKAKPHIVP